VVTDYITPIPSADGAPLKAAVSYSLNLPSFAVDPIAGRDLTLPGVPALRSPEVGG
jgi:hypothetical protein